MFHLILLESENVPTPGTSGNITELFEDVRLDPIDTETNYSDGDVDMPTG